MWLILIFYEAGYLCDSMHTRNCNFNTTLPMVNLKLIDCITRKLAPAGNSSYSALSYTWGQNEKPPTYSEKLSQKLPSTIEDAITVTIQLGYRYLWVDRYCIDQECEVEAKKQIQNMDSIYQNSVFTIIAAAGLGPSYGLPGISTSRTVPLHLKFGHNYLVYPGMLAKRFVIAESPWASRG